MRTSNIEHRTSNIEHRTSNFEHRTSNIEIYLAPPPPSKGRIIGLDCHPDTFTAAVFRGTTPHDARKLSTHPDMSLKKLLDWAEKEFTHDDLFLMEAGSNSFEIHRRLLALGLRAVVMESCHVGKHAKTYADNDKMAAARIALVYLQGKAPLCLGSRLYHLRTPQGSVTAYRSANLRSR